MSVHRGSREARRLRQRVPMREHEAMEEQLWGRYEHLWDCYRRLEIAALTAMTDPSDANLNALYTVLMESGADRRVVPPEKARSHE